MNIYWTLAIIIASLSVHSITAQIIHSKPNWSYVVQEYIKLLIMLKSG